MADDIEPLASAEEVDELLTFIGRRPVVADDIVTRLRNWGRARSGSGDRCEQMHRDAADEIERLRAAIDALLTDIDGDHRHEWSSDEAEAAGKEPWCCAWCGAADGGWPCVHRRALDELKEARRG